MSIFELFSCLVLAEFDSVKYSVFLENFLFHSALVSMTPPCPVCLLLPWQDYFCLLSSITLLSQSLQYFCGLSSILSPLLLSIQLVFVRDRTSIF